MSEERSSWTPRTGGTRNRKAIFPRRICSSRCSACGLWKKSQRQESSGCSTEAGWRAKLHMCKDRRHRVSWGGSANNSTQTEAVGCGDTAGRLSTRAGSKGDLLPQEPGGSGQPWRGSGLGRSREQGAEDAAALGASRGSVPAPAGRIGGGSGGNTGSGRWKPVRLKVARESASKRECEAMQNATSTRRRPRQGKVKCSLFQAGSKQGFSATGSA